MGESGCESTSFQLLPNNKRVNQKQTHVSQIYLESFYGDEKKMTSFRLMAILQASASCVDERTKSTTAVSRLDKIAAVTISSAIFKS
jgi:hypothetical protein